MKEQDEQYYSAKMLVLADTFNEMAQIVDQTVGIEPEFDSKIVSLRDSFLKFSDAAYAEFEKAGYNADDWDSLFERSGAIAKMGLC